MHIVIWSQVFPSNTIFRYINLIDRWTNTWTNTQSQSGPGSNDIETVLHTFQSSRTSLVSCSGRPLQGIQSGYSKSQ